MIIRRKALLIRRKDSLILGIETSCDETSASIIKNGTQILSNVVASSQELHIKTGGIIPEMAAREQIKYMIPVIQEALRTGCGWVVSCEQNPITHNSPPPVDAIAVTVGPGLIGSLLIGVETAKTLSYLWNKPIIPVNHLLAHVYANWLDNNVPCFPLIALIVSGGHTELILIKNHGKYEWLGGTRDDAAGECFDKIARLLGLGYPGGPAIAAAAAQFQIKNFKFQIKLPRPMIDSDDLDFSFSGLKTAVLRETQKSNLTNLPNWTNAIAFEVQEAITDVLVEKAVRAAKEYNVKNILLAGGVAANQRLRKKMSLKIKQSFSSNENLKLKIRLSVPPPSLCTDNAAAIAGCAFFNYKPVPWQKISTNPSLGL